MNIIDLHQDRSDNALCTTHKDFFAPEANDGWNAEKMDALNQVDFSRLKQANMSAVVAAIFIDPDAMHVVDVARFELGRHLKYYNRVIEKSQGGIYEILSSADLLTNISDRTKIGLLKHLEGFYFLDPQDRQFAILDEVYKSGVRSVAMTRGTDSNMCGGNEHNNKGLSPLGKSFVEKLASEKILIDLAHISQQGFDDVMDIVNKPVMVSHTKITDASDKARFLTVTQAKRVADTGGVIGMMTMKVEDDGLPVTDLSSYVSHMRRAINTIGEDHVAMGTDFDGLTREHTIGGFTHIGEVDLLIEEMEKQHISYNQIEKVLGNNALRFLQENI